MNKKSVIVPEGSFHSPLVGIIAALSAVTALSGALSLLFSILPDAFYLLDAASVDASAKFTWGLIHVFFILFTTVLGALLTICLLFVLTGKRDKGLGLLSSGLRILFYAVTIIGIGMLVLFVIRAAIYSFALGGAGGGMGFVVLVPILLAELLLVVVAAALFFLMRKFLDSASDGAIFIAGTLRTGVLKYPILSMTPATGSLILGVAGLYLCWNRISTILAWAGKDFAASSFLTLYGSAAMFLFGGVAAILLFLYLRKFKMTCEYLMYKGIPVESEE